MDDMRHEPTLAEKAEIKRRKIQLDFRRALLLRRWNKRSRSVRHYGQPWGIYPRFKPVSSLYYRAGKEAAGGGYRIIREGKTG